MAISEKPFACDGCVRFKQYGSRGFVPGKGKRNATLLALGEQPGVHEIGACSCPVEAHPIGEPFVFATGKELTKGLGGTRTGVYCTNVRKCLGYDNEPPNIRDASIAYCVNAYLKDELADLVNVNTVLAIGADALDVTTGIREVTKFHGSVLTADEARAAGLMKEAALARKKAK